MEKRTRRPTTEGVALERVIIALMLIPKCSLWKGKLEEQP
jgi:hypothetical protein